MTAHNDEGWCVAFDKGVFEGERRAKERIRKAYLAWCECNDNNIVAKEDALHEALELGLGDEERVQL